MLHFLKKITPKAAITLGFMFFPKIGINSTSSGCQKLGQVCAHQLP